MNKVLLNVGICVLVAAIAGVIFPVILTVKKLTATAIGTGIGDGVLLVTGVTLVVASTLTKKEELNCSTQPYDDGCPCVFSGECESFICRDQVCRTLDQNPN